MNRSFFVALDVNFYDHPKVVEAGEAADRLYTAALCLAKRTWSDGYVSDAQIARLGLADVDDRAKRLEAVGLFDRDPDRPGWLIHDWSDHNRTKEEQDSIVEKRREAGRKGGKQGAKAKSKRPPKQLASNVVKQDANQVGQPDSDLDSDLDLDSDPDRESDRDPAPEPSPAPPQGADKPGDEDDDSFVGHPADAVIEPLGIVSGPGRHPTKGERRFVERARQRGWPLEQLVDLGHLAAGKREPREYLLAALADKANNDPPPDGERDPAGVESVNRSTAVNDWSVNWSIVKELVRREGLGPAISLADSPDPPDNLTPRTAKALLAIRHTLRDDTEQSAKFAFRDAYQESTDEA